MIIGLYNLEPHIVNTALMQISTYHKSLGHTVEWYRHYNKWRYDKVYASSIFDFTPKVYITDDMVCGGTGFNLTTKLPPEIEGCEYDYTLYPDCDYSIVWFSRGCIRNCPFCIVRMKEGFIYPVKPKNLNPTGSWIRVMDNNFFANPYWPIAIDQLKKWNQPVQFEGVDVRIITDGQCKALNSLTHKGRIHIAWDDPREDLTEHFEKMIQYIKPYKIMVYVLIGYWSTPDEDLLRVKIIDSYGMDPYAMPYNKSDPYQRRFARWVNHKATFKSCEFKDYHG